jgi:hypothetical protein
MLLLVPVLALAGSVTQTFTFNPDEVGLTRVNDYDLLSLRDCISTSQPGAPIVPQAILTFLVPANATVTTVEVLNSSRTELAGSYRLHPAQTPRTLSEKRELPFVEPDPAIYGSAQAFPGKFVDFGYTGTKTGYRLCGVSLFPVQYVPLTGKVTLYTSLTLRVTYSEGSYDAVPLTAKQIAVGGEAVRRLVCNTDDVKSFAPPKREADVADAEYVIVTADAYVSTLQPLADWHSRKGYTSIIKTNTWIYSNYTGYDNAEKIRNFIIDYYTNHGTIYVLLAGNTSAIPSRRGYANVSGTVGNVPADLYYGDLQWSWDGNGNRVYGESNGDTVDFYYDVFVGRWPAGSTTNCQTLVNKVFGYEKAPNSSFIKKAYLPYVNLFSGYSGKVVSDTIMGITPTGWTDTEVNSPSTSAFQTAINTGYGYCHGAAHGDDYGFYTDMGTPIYTTTQAGAQSNGMDKLNVMNAMACISGNFENTSALSVVLANNANGGTVANMLNSREGWGTPPSMGPSEKMDVRFYDFLLNRDTFLVGPAMSRSKEVYATLPQGQEVWRWCYYDINLLGDPAMPLWSDVPGTMTMTKPDSVFTGTNSVHIVVSSGSPLANANVGLYKAGEVCARGRTNSSGVVDILVNPSTAGKLYVLATAQDKLPLQDSIRVVVGAATPYVNLLNVTVQEVGGNGNGRWDPGENANITATMENLGNATAVTTQDWLRTASSYVTFTDSTSSYGDIAPGSSVVGDAHTASASSGTPPGTVVNFTFHVTCTQGSWDYNWSTTIGQGQQPGAVWSDIDTADCLLTVTGLGSIGITTPDGEGHGFKWPKAGTSKLYYSGLLIGNAANYIVDHYYGNPASSVNTDFVMADSVRRVLPVTWGDEMYRSEMTDAGHSTPKSLRVTQRAIQVAAPAYNTFTVLVYDIQNQGASPVNGCYAGIMTDFDIYTSTTPSDQVRTNTNKRHAWMRGSNSANPTLGTRVLAPPVASNLSAIDHDVWVYPDSAMTESMKYRFLNGTLRFATSNRNYDWSIVTATGPFDLAAGGSQRVAFAMLGGTDSTTFNANSDSAQSWYDRMAGIFEESVQGPTPGFSFIRLAPNPFTNATRISYVLPSAGRLTIRAYDASGRMVADVFDQELKAGSGALNWSPHELPGGIYFLKATLPQGVQTEKFVLTR